VFPLLIWFLTSLIKPIQYRRHGGETTPVEISNFLTAPDFVGAHMIIEKKRHGW